MEWSIIAWHVTTHCVAVWQCHFRIATCMELLHLAMTAEKNFTPVDFAISLCPQATLSEPVPPQDVSSMHRTIWNRSLLSFVAWTCNRPTDLMTPVP